MFLACLAIGLTQPWTLVCAGDIMLNGLTPSETRLQIAKPLFSKADISMANLEVPLTNARTPTLRKSPREIKERSQFILKANPACGRWLHSWGLKVLTQGNNHAMDYRATGLRQMLDLLDSQSILHTGAGKDWKAAWTPVDVPLAGGDHVRIGAALAFAGVQGMRKCTPATKSGPGVATLLYQSPKALKSLVARLRNGSGPVILFLHWGQERTSVPRAYQVRLGRALIDAGADAVIGAHPHVFQGAELYRGKPILYSLGNLIAPAGGETGIATLHFTGREFKSLTLLPYLDRSGVLCATSRSEGERFLRSFAGYSAAIQKAFPNPASQLLTSR